MCGRCRQVFNAFESLKRVEDNSATANVAADLGNIANEAGIKSLADVVRKTAYASPVTTSAHNELSIEAAPNSPLLNQPVANVPSDLSIVENRSILLTDHASILERADDKLPISDALIVKEDDSLLDGADDVAGKPQIQEISALDDHNPVWLRVAPPKPPRNKLWLVGCLLLIVVLVAQASYFLRTTIVETVPQARPYFRTACEVLGCVMSWGRDSNAIKIIESDLIEPPGKPGRLLVTATVANRGTSKQDLPFIELRLTDNANQVLVSRILQPADYLGRQPLPDEGLAPNAELLINLNIESTNKSIASGYGLRAYYP